MIPQLNLRNFFIRIEKLLIYDFTFNQFYDILGEFLSQVSLVSDIDSYEDEAQALTLMTLHAAKGLEFDTVFLSGLEEGIFPHSRSLDAPSEMEEERRLMYVGITRAKKNLWMMNAKKRMLFGNTQVNMPSRFMDEIDMRYMDVENNKTTIIDKMVNFKKEDKFRNEDVSYNVGDHVSHDTFGEGVVIMCDKSLITIAFPHPHGVKKMMKNHKSLVKL